MNTWGRMRAGWSFGMGTLRENRTGRLIALPARARVGRAADCAVRIDSRLVSNAHATLWWEDGRWHVRDHGSRNGTRMAGQPLAPGSRAPIGPDDVLVFGDDANAYTVVDIHAPPARARAGETVVFGEGGVLCLPTPDDPQVMIFEGADGTWLLDGASGGETAVDGGVIVVAGRAWVLELPVPDAGTWAPEARATSLGLSFRVSRDEEYVELWVEVGGPPVQLATRAHTELLLLLARARVEDDAHPEPERGWRYADDARERLGLDSAAFNLHVFRARQQLSEGGHAGLAAIIERRGTTGQIRIAGARVEVLPLSVPPPL